MKKLLSVLSVLCLFCLTVCLFTACGEKDATLTLSYNEEGGTVTVSAPKSESEDIKVGETVTVTVTKTGYVIGETVSAEITPKAGYLIGAVTLNGEALEVTEGSVSFSLEKEENVLSVTFEEDTRTTASVTIEETVGGTLSLPATDLRVGDTARLSLTPSSRRYRVASVTQNGKPLTPTADGYSVTLGVENVFHAVFEEIPNARFTFVNDESLGALTLSAPEDPAYLVGDRVSATVRVQKRGDAVASLRVNGTEITPTNGVYFFTLAESNEIAVTYGAAAEVGITTDCDRAFGKITVSAPIDGARYLVGDTVTITVSPEGYRTMTVVGAPVRMKERRDPKVKGVDEWVHASALKAVYDEKNDKIIFTDSAKLARSENGLVKDSAAGARITYDLLNAKSRVEGETVNGQKTRVSTVLAPRAKNGTTQPAPRRAAPAPMTGSSRLE